jgi:hypothetical protein
LVEKRTLTLVALATVAWALIATSFAAYYFLQRATVQEQFNEKQGLLGELSSDYAVMTAKSNLVAGDYSTLFGDYQWFGGEDYSSFMGEYQALLANLKGNYSLTLGNSPDLNETYNSLLNETQALAARNVVTPEEFRSLLDQFYKLFTSLALRELDGLLGRTSVIHVSLLIDYGNGTERWFNDTAISPDVTLFDVTRQVANVTYSYWSSMEPGHILLSSINGHATGYWVWYYWDETSGQWVFGPVGCDAWTLKDNGVYEWFSS